MVHALVLGALHIALHKKHTTHIRCSCMFIFNLCIHYLHIYLFYEMKIAF